MGPCLCGDIQCPTCGPAQGNFKCPICHTWVDDQCEHLTDDGQGVRFDFVYQWVRAEQAHDIPEPPVSPFVDGVE